MAWNGSKPIELKAAIDYGLNEAPEEELEKLDGQNFNLMRINHQPLKAAPELYVANKSRRRPQIWSQLQRRRRGFLVIFGAVLVQLTLGTVFTIGNMSPYMISYMRQHNEPNVTNNHIVWINAMETGVQGLVMPLGGVLERRVGSRLTGLLGSAIMSCGTAVTYFTIRTTYVNVLLTYGALFGAGVGIGYIAMIAVGMRWFPNNRGVVNGVTIGAFGFGSFIFNLVMTAFLNPENVSPGREGYFIDERVLSRVPDVFLLLGGIYGVTQLIGCLLVTGPPKDLELSDKDESSVSPGQALKTPQFYMLWFTMLLNVQAVTYFNSMYKTFGQTFIKDDQFLALVGAVCAVSNAVGRVAWGFLIDRYRYKRCMLALCTHVIVLLATIQFTRHWDKRLYAVWSFLLFLGLAGTYTLISTCVSHTYGPKHAGTIYGMVFVNNAIGGPITALTTQYLSTFIGFIGIFYLLAGFSFISLVITTLFKERFVTTE